MLIKEKNDLKLPTLPVLPAENPFFPKHRYLYYLIFTTTMKSIAVYLKDKFYIFLGSCIARRIYSCCISPLKVGKLNYRIYTHVLSVLTAGGDFFRYGDLIDKMRDCVGK